MHFLKKGQKIRALADPPLIRAMPERKVFFLLMSSLKRNKNDLLISPLSVAPSCVFCVHLVSTIVNLQLHLTVFCVWIQLHLAEQLSVKFVWVVVLLKICLGGSTLENVLLKEILWDSPTISAAKVLWKILVKVQCGFCGGTTSCETWLEQMLRRNCSS